MGQVQSYKRKITYFYQYHNGNVGATAGFLKLEIRGDKVKIIINIQEPPGLPYKDASLYFYHEAGDHLAAVKVGEVESMSGVLSYQNRTDWQQLFDTGRDLYTFDGVAVVYNDSHYFIGDFNDKDRKDYELVRKDNRKNTITEPKNPFGKKDNTIREAEKVEKVRPQRAVKVEEEIEQGNTDNIDMEAAQELVMEPKPKQEAKPDLGEESEGEMPEREASEQENLFDADNKKDVYDKCEDCPYQKKRMERSEERDAFEKMIEEYPKLPMYGATELFNCVRIHPKDIGKLDMRNWKLGVNSFLTHGYYTYQYLLLGKMRFDDGSEHAIIGVPGVFSNREKYLANMFGFEQFIPVKKVGVKTGEFGYWIVEITPGL